MAYTPINWQTGDTITAEKLNRCDNGWGVESTQLFSETVTTADDGEGFNVGTLAYASTIDADTLAVTFDGTDYECNRIDAFGSHFYGGFNNGPDFTEYPFFIDVEPEGNMLYTQTAGTHTVTAVTLATVTSTAFNNAVITSMGNGLFPMECIPNVTTYDEMLSAKEARRLLYFYAGSTMHIITYFLEAESETAVQAVPAGTENIETYGFEDIDGTLVFRIFVY